VPLPCIDATRLGVEHPASVAIAAVSEMTKRFFISSSLVQLSSRQEDHPAHVWRKLFFRGRTFQQASAFFFVSGRAKNVGTLTTEGEQLFHPDRKYIPDATNYGLHQRERKI
jgi:hypothetical protein